MKNRVCVSSFIILLILSVISSCSNENEVFVEGKSFQVENESKREALKQIKIYYEDGKYHKDVVLKIANLVTDSNHNLDVLCKAAKLASSVGHHTVALLEIAEIASEAKNECNELDSILELTVMTMTNTGQFPKLAQRATDSADEMELEQIRAEIDQLKTAAEYKSIEDVIEG